MLPEKLKNMLKKQHYALVGKHSAVQICKYTKESLRGKDFCYKQKFYGIQSHRCVQMSPAIAFCYHRCVFCWRPIEFTLQKIRKPDEASKIVDGCIEAQRRLLSGFLGNKKIDKAKFFEAQEPKHFAISLAGEPTLYCKLPELILELRKRKITSFLVTNGENPEMIRKMMKENALPTQLYISLNASNDRVFKKICRPITGSWKKILESLKLLSKLKTRTAIRITLIKNLNMIKPEEYAALIKIANPNFVEIKAYMHIGFSQFRLKKENMPSHTEIKKFAREIEKLTEYKIVDEKENSRVVLLMKDEKDRFIEFE
ncbi:MAG: 4-demethylwyosine synthase TYW1 [Candidatus Pacearchaeota archaeon]